MRFTSQEEYGLRCLLQLARSAEQRLTIADIAEHEGLTSAYVAKLLSVLQGAGLVASIRGRGGGYRLARDPADIDLATVMLALDGRLYNTEFCGRHAGNEPTCVHDTNCTIRSLWRVLDDAVQGTLGRTSLADLLGSERAATVRIGTPTPGASAGD